MEFVHEDNGFAFASQLAHITSLHIGNLIVVNVAVA
jgi:hypothetical protein